MSEIEVREFQPDDIESFHALHDAVFPPVPFEEMRRWMARDDVTAGVAVQDDRISTFTHRALRFGSHCPTTNRLNMSESRADIR